VERKIREMVTHHMFEFKVWCGPCGEEEMDVMIVRGITGSGPVNCQHRSVLDQSSF